MIEPPIVCVYENPGEVRVFRDLREAESAVEGIDIEPGDIAYDRNGLALRFKPIGVDMSRGMTGHHEP